MVTKTKVTNYKGYKIECYDGNCLAYKRNVLVAGEDTLKELKLTLDEMIKQGVQHESELQ